MTDDKSSTIATALVAAATGARSMSGLAAVARRVSAEGDAADLPQPARFLASPPVPAVVTALAALELVADKVPGIPNRTDALPLIGRVGIGALAGAAIGAATGSDRTRGAVVGAAVAFLSAHLSFRGRRDLADLSSPMLAAAFEDSAVAGLAAAGAAAIDVANTTGAQGSSVAASDSAPEGA